MLLAIGGVQLEVAEAGLLLDILLEVTLHLLHVSSMAALGAYVLSKNAHHHLVVINDTGEFLVIGGVPIKQGVDNTCGEGDRRAGQRGPRLTSWHHNGGKFGLWVRNPS